jgi:XTP/dITP diphosphohydrolase
MRKIILASNNQGKIKEFNFMLKGVYEVVSMGDMGVKEVPETGLTLVENALIGQQKRWHNKNRHFYF